MTSLVYQPDPGAKPDRHWETVYLSMRDVCGEIPINYIPVPGVDLTTACFSNGIYDDVPAQTCISDLLATEFRRLVIDLYWDNINRQFNLCPVELPPLVGNATAGYSVDLSALSSITASTYDTATPIFTSNASSTDGVVPRLGKRQTSSGNSTASTPTPTSTDTVTSKDNAPIPTSTGVSGTTLLELGPYRCSLDLNLDSIISLYRSYIDKTSNTVSARLQYLIVNLHAAAPFTDPSAPAHTPMPGRLPDPDELVGAKFQSAIPQGLYSPSDLEEDRQNLNRSWYRDNYRVVTDANFFHTLPASDGSLSTEDGWPGETWILLTDSRRLLLSWGERDTQMQAYDFQGDSDNVFSSAELQRQPVVAWNDAGNVTSGCFYRPGETQLAQVNSSWAMANVNASNQGVVPDILQNLTACGISPILNLTVGDSVVPDSLAQYETMVQAAVFGWAPGEPMNGSSSGEGTANPSDASRCAVIDSTTAFQGHWRASDCSRSHRVACRVNSQPYEWLLSTRNVEFAGASDACPEDSTFGVPRTGLENTYLYRQILTATSGGGGGAAGGDDGDDNVNSILSGVWINFNSLDEPDCWVIGGSNASCPYSDYLQEEQQRQVLIPTIAALIVLILTVLTILVKCNQNRRKSHTRRRGENGWEYEGVPS